MQWGLMKLQWRSGLDIPAQLNGVKNSVWWLRMEPTSEALVLGRGTTNLKGGEGRQSWLRPAGSRGGEG